MLCLSGFELSLGAPAGLTETFVNGKHLSIAEKSRALSVQKK